MPAELAGHRQRACVQRHPEPPDVRPEHRRAGVVREGAVGIVHGRLFFVRGPRRRRLEQGLEPRPQSLRDLGGARLEPGKVAAALRGLRQCRLGRLDRRGQPLDGAVQFAHRAKPAVIEAGGRAGLQPELAQPRFDRRRARHPVVGIRRIRPPDPDQVARQFGELARRHGDPEELGRDIGQLVGLVEDQYLRCRKQLRDTLVAQGQVGAEQVVVDDDHIGLHGPAPGAHQETVVEARAVLAEAVLAGGDRLRPRRRVLRDAGRLGPVAAARQGREALDASQHGGILAALEAALEQVALEVVMADVVGPTLEHGDPGRHPQGRRQGRQVTGDQLVLQVAGPGGDERPGAGEQGRHQVGEGLAGTGARLGDQGTARLDASGDREGHVLLRLAHGIAGTPREGPGRGIEDAEHRVAELAGRHATRLDGVRGGQSGVQAWMSGTSCICRTTIASLICSLRFFRRRNWSSSKPPSREIASIMESSPRCSSTSSAIRRLIASWG